MRGEVLRVHPPFFAGRQALDGCTAERTVGPTAGDAQWPAYAIVAIGPRAGGHNTRRSGLKPMHYFSLAGVLVPLVLYVAGHAEAAGVVIVLALVIEVLVSAITGKKGNATER